MNPYERQILNDAEEQVFQTQQQFNEAQETSGIRPPPDVEETESVLEPQLFGMWFGGQPESEVVPVSSAPTPAGCDPCATTLVLTFSGVTFSCGCLLGVNLSDTGGFNGVPITIYLGEQPTFSPFANHCSTDCFHGDYVSHCGQFSIHRKLFAAGCSNPQTGEDDATDCGPGFPVFNLFQGFVSGRWYVALYIGSITRIFYGSVADIASPISNESFCDGTGSLYDDPFLRCIYAHTFPPGITQFGIASGGTATLTC